MIMFVGLSSLLMIIDTLTFTTPYKIILMRTAWYLLHIKSHKEATFTIKTVIARLFLFVA